MQPFLDVFAVLIFLGVVQGVFLCVFFLTRGGEFALSNRFFGFVLLSAAAIIFEMFLGYTGYLVRVIHLLDFSEPVNFTIGPLLYVMVRARIEPVGGAKWRYLLHFVPFVFYAIYQIPYGMQGADFKYYVWLEAWHPDVAVTHDGAYPSGNIDPLHLRANLAELTVIHMFAYAVGALWAVRQAFHRLGQPLWSHEPRELSWLRSFTLQVLLLIVVVVAVKLTFPNDVGDYLIATVVTVIIYATSIRVVWRSSFFGEGPTSVGQKYEKSALTPEIRDSVLERLKSVMAEEKPYLQPSMTLRGLAGRVNVSPHHLSQVLNEALGSTFYDYLARHRIEEAKRLLSGPERTGLRIEDVAERVGYFSKSTFNTAFKRFTGMTPSAFRDSLTHD